MKQQNFYETKDEWLKQHPTQERRYDAAKKRNNLVDLNGSIWFVIQVGKRSIDFGK